MSEVTKILMALDQGQSQAAEKLLPLVYDELRRLAAWHLANEKPGQTLQATALVHEAWLKLVGEQDPRWNGRRHFFGAAAEAMRRILVENARRKKRLKRGGHLAALTWTRSRFPCRCRMTICWRWMKHSTGWRRSSCARLNWSSSVSLSV